MIAHSIEINEKSAKRVQTKRKTQEEDDHPTAPPETSSHIHQHDWTLQRPSTGGQETGLAASLGPSLHDKDQIRGDYMTTQHQHIRNPQKSEGSERHPHGEARRRQVPGSQEHPHAYVHNKKRVRKQTPPKFRATATSDQINMGKCLIQRPPRGRLSGRCS